MSLKEKIQKFFDRDNDIVYDTIFGIDLERKEYFEIIKFYLDNK